MPGWTPADLLPGLYVAACAVGLAAALRRWFDPVPRGVLALFLAVVGLLFAPVLVGGRVLLPLDALTRAAPFYEPEPPTGNRLQAEVALVFAPERAAVRRALGAGEWPLANPYAGAGAALLAAPEAQPFAPLVVAALPFPLDRAAGVTAALAVLVALLFTFLLLRRDGAPEAAALAGALAYGLGGGVVLWLGWPLAHAAALLPVAVYAATLAAGRGARRDFAFLAATAAALVLAGDRNVAGYALLATVAYLVVRLARERAPADRGGPFVAALVALALGIGAAAPAVLSVAAQAPETAQAAALEARAEDALANDPLGLATLGDRDRRGPALAAAGRRLLALAAPRAFGDDRFGAYWGPGNVNEDAAGFAGTGTLLAALLAAGIAALRPAKALLGRLVAPGTPDHPPARAAGGLPGEGPFAGVAVVILAVVAWPQGAAPLLDHVLLLHPAPDDHRRLAIVLGFAAAYLAASALARLGAPRADGGDRSKSRSRAFAAGPVLGVAGALAVLLAWAYLAHPPPPEAAFLAGRHRGWLALQLAALALTAGALAIGPSAARARRDRAPAAAAVAACAVAAELLLLHGPANPSMPRRLAYPTPAPVAFLQRAVAADPGARICGYKSAFPPALATVYALADPRFGGPGRPWAYGELVVPLVAPGGEWAPLFARPEHPLYDLLGARYLLTAPGVGLSAPFRLLFDDPAGRVWERPRPLPRLFLPTAAEIYRGGRWQDRVHHTPDFVASTLVQPSPGHGWDWSAPSAPAAPTDRTDTLTIDDLAATRVRATASLGGERLMASSIYQDGGWRLLVDGHPQPTVLANGPLVGAWLPPGPHRLDLLYRPGPFVAGTLLAALALAILTAWLAIPTSPSSLFEPRSAGETAEAAGRRPGRAAPTARSTPTSANRRRPGARAAQAGAHPPQSPRRPPVPARDAGRPPERSEVHRA